MNPRISFITRISSWVAWFAWALLLAGLGYFAYAGTFVRFWADDYCYSAVMHLNGFFGGLAQWYQASGNRFTTPAVVALSDLFGRNVIGWVPLGVILLWMIAWIACLVQFTRLAGLKVKAVWFILAAVAEVYFAVLLAPDRLQTIYWRMGTFHYALPLPLLLLNLALLATSARSLQNKQAWFLLVSLVLAFLTAGLSETFAAFQAGLSALGILLSLVILQGKRSGEWALRCLAPLVGSALAMVVMVFSPSNAWRSAALPPPDNLLLIIPYTLRYTANFIFYTLRGQPVPYAVYFLGVAGVALLAWPWEAAAPRMRQSWLGLAVALAMTYALIACSFAPSSYAGLQYPAGRAQMPAEFTLLAGLAAAACYLVGITRRILGQPGWLAAGAVVCLLLIGLYPLRAAAIARQDVARLGTWAARWDERSAQIVQQISSGQLDVQVRQIEVVQTLEDLGPEPNFWINSCASALYGAHSIQANP